MLDHVAIQVQDVGVSAEFYARALAPLGGTRLKEYGANAGFGTAGHPPFWLVPAKDGGGAPREAHLAFAAPDRAAVDAFHAACVAAGAESLHAPRLWPEYHGAYYGAFVRDPDGNNVEAVCHTAR
ncbi:VOC family protein [Streptomyces sp. HNM0574]|uniref:VOC family protein n=1 Tax=Streptomyces sp. HNM0574 TaxID=2714954 RepID=UPI001469F722|nr:VOC family protein [Streptomyces sp. HNM0574]NLU69884.1 VOC family protein [Streptomyces sp. HNM0574]